MLTFYNHLQPPVAQQIVRIIMQNTYQCIDVIYKEGISADIATLMQMEAIVFYNHINVKSMLRFMTNLINKCFNTIDEARFDKIFDVILGESTIMSIMKLTQSPSNKSNINHINFIIDKLACDKQISAFSLDNKLEYTNFIDYFIKFILSNNMQQQRQNNHERYKNTQLQADNTSKQSQSANIREYLVQLFQNIQKQISNRKLFINPSQQENIMIQDIIQIQTLALIPEQRIQLFMFVLNQHQHKKYSNRMVKNNLNSAAIPWNESSFLNVINTLRGNTLLYKILVSDNDQYQQILNDTFNSCSYYKIQRKQLIQIILSKVINYQYQYIGISKDVEKKRLLTYKNTYTFMQQFVKHQQFKQQMYKDLLANNYYQVKKMVAICQQQNNIQCNYIKAKFIQQLYKLYQRAEEKDYQYHILCIIKYCYYGPWPSLFKELRIISEKDIETVIQQLEAGMKSVNSAEVLKTVLVISKHIEMSQISLCFSKKFTLQDLSDDIVNQMFNNITNRIQYVYLNAKSNTRELLLLRRSDGMIFKSNYVSDDAIEQVFNKGHDQLFTISQDCKSSLRTSHIENDSDVSFCTIENDTPMNIYTDDSNYTFKKQQISLNNIKQSQSANNSNQINLQPVSDHNGIVGDQLSNVNNKYTYDAIIITSKQMKKLSLLQYTSFCYVSSQSMQGRIVQLGKQPNLLSICLNNVDFQNYDDCTNLRNIYLSYLMLNEDCFVSHKSIQRLYCKFVNYCAMDSMLQQIIKANSLEYVQFNYCTNFISNGDTLLHNLDNLRVFLTNSTELITVDLNNQDLKNISVFQSKMKHNIIGPVNRIQNMKNQLISQIYDVYG